MTWTQLLANNEVQRHRTSKKELDRLRAFIGRDLADASIDSVSADRRFATAYNAALQAAKIAIPCAGYRVVGTGHHRISFEVVNLAMGKAAAPYGDYFDDVGGNGTRLITTTLSSLLQLKQRRLSPRPKNSLR